ncbi:transposase [Nocardia sp. NPDC059246]|uniref:transposase n=1 Tax=unclassified Nocardia TaxID=2637762 RepID=UPI0036A90A8B
MFRGAAPWIVDDELWAVIEPLLPVKPAGTPGPPQRDSRRVLQGILFVLITGIGWEDLPQENGSLLGCRARLGREHFSLGRRASRYR